MALLTASVVAWLVSAAERRTDRRLRALQRDLQLVMRHLDLHTTAERLGERGPELTALLRDGRKIQAIKLYRDLTGATLKQAKDAVEELEAR